MGIARDSSTTLASVSSLEGRIMDAELPDDQQNAALDRASQIRAMVLGVDLAMVMAAGENYDQPKSAKINAAAETAHRHFRSFLDRPAELFARTASSPAEWSAFETEADVLMSELRNRLNQ